MLTARRRGPAKLLLVGAMLLRQMLPRQMFPRQMPLRQMLLGATLFACFDDREIRFVDDVPGASSGGAAGTAGRAGAGGAITSTLPPAGGAPSGGAPNGGAAGSVSPVSLPSPSEGVTSLAVDAGAGASGDAGSPP